MNDPLARQLDPIRRGAWIASAIAAMFCLLGAFFSHGQFFRSWLFASLFWLGISLGALVILMMQFLTGGAWGFAIRRLCEAAIAVLPLLALLFLPVLFGIRDFFSWMHSGTPHPHNWTHKQIYLSEPFFIARTVLYFAVLIALAVALRYWSVQRDLGVANATKRLQRVSSGGLVAYVLCMNFASTDWVLSLEPEWYSTILVIIFVSSQFLSSLALMTVLLAALSQREPLASTLTTKHFHDLGNLLLAFVIFWAYVTFSQFLIIWSGNLPKEIGWYVHRRSGGWQWAALALATFQFFAPFALLLSRAAKRHKQRLAAIAGLIFAATIVNVFWLVAPAFHPNALRVHWLDVAAFVAIGAAWSAMFCSFLKERPLLPVERAL